MRKIILKKENIKFEVDSSGPLFKNSSEVAPPFTNKEIMRLAMDSLKNIKR
jgi:hypothetical protein